MTRMSDKLKPLIGEKALINSHSQACTYLDFEWIKKNPVEGSAVGVLMEVGEDYVTLKTDSGRTTNIISMNGLRVVF